MFILNIRLNVSRKLFSDIPWNLENWTSETNNREAWCNSHKKQLANGFQIIWLDLRCVVILLEKRTANKIAQLANIYTISWSLQANLYLTDFAIGIGPTLKYFIN